MSSNTLSAYKKFRQIEKKAELEKRKRFEIEVRQKYDVEITDATVFKSSAALVKNDSQNCASKQVVTGPQYSLIGEAKREFESQVGKDGESSITPSAATIDLNRKLLS